MIVRIQRGKPVNKTVEIETDSVIHSEVFGTGGRLSFDNGDMIALNGVEWAQWLDANSWVEETIGIKDLHKYEKGKIR